MCTHDKRNYRQLTFTFTGMKNERYFHNQLTNCFVISMHYSWWLFHKINQKSFEQDIGHKFRTISRFRDTMLKNKVVHLSTIHGKAFEIPPIFFQQANCKFLLQKEIVLLTIRPHQSYQGKKPPFSLRFLLLYKKTKWLGYPK